MLRRRPSGRPFAVLVENNKIPRAVRFHATGNGPCTDRTAADGRAAQLLRLLAPNTTRRMSIGEKSDGMPFTTVGYFDNHAAADAAYQDLRASGLSQQSVSLVARGRQDGGLADEDEIVTAGDGAKFGGIAGLLLGAAVMLIPGIGPILAVGPLAAGLAGVVTGGVGGAVLGGVAAGLVHAGLTEDEATYYDQRLHQGGYLLTVHTDEADPHNAREVLEHHGAEMHDLDAITNGRVTAKMTAVPTVGNHVGAQQSPILPTP